MPVSELDADQLARYDRARLAPLVGMAEPEPASQPVLDPDDDKQQYLTVRKLREQYLDYLNTKVNEIEEQKDSRRYYHGAHWDEAALKILRGRRQPPQTWNRVARKINSIVGLVERMRSDPKALPRTPKNEQGAEIATQSIRYVLDANEWKTLDPWCLLQAGIDGVAGVQMELTQGDKGDPDLLFKWVIGDEYFYDPKSYRQDFADARYEGIAKWLDLEEAIELHPDKQDALRGLIEGDSDMTTNADREYTWVISSTQRIRMVEHWYKHRGQWCYAHYCANVLLDQGVSPFPDDKGKPGRSFVMFGAAVDHDGDRYSFVRNLKGPQDALNQGKSKTLHIANSRRLLMEKNAVDDVEIARREYARPDGVVEYNPGKKPEPDNQQVDLAAFSQFTEDAKAELDQYANVNMAAMTGASLANISGRAIELLRQPGMAELGPFILAYRGFKLRLYRGIWNAIQRHWTTERWVRVTNNEGLAQFMQVNALDLDQFGRPMIVNAVGSLDVDIILEEGPDIGTMMQETYEMMRGYPPGTFPAQVLIEFSPLSRSEKNRALQMLTPKPPPPNPMAEMAGKLQLEGIAARNAKTAAEVRKTHAGAEELQARAEKERASVGTEAARAGHLAMASHLDAAEFARDTLKQAHELTTQSQPQPVPVNHDPFAG